MKEYPKTLEELERQFAREGGHAFSTCMLCGSLKGLHARDAGPGKLGSPGEGCVNVQPVRIRSRQRLERSLKGADCP